MAITISWTPDGQPTTTLKINDAAQASLDSYRASLPQPPVDILTLVLQTIGPVLLVPAFGAKPPADVATAQEAAATAQANATQAMQNFIQSAITVTGATNG